MRLKLPTIRFPLPKFLVKKPEVNFSLGKTNLSRKQKALRILSVFLLVIGTLTVFLLVKTKPTKAAWYSSTWTYRIKLTIDQTKISGSSALTNFPVLVSITNTGLQNYAQSDGDDILFTLSDGTTKLNHEIEQYTSGSGTLVAWVQIPSLSATVDTDLYLYYGNAVVASQQSVTATWDSTFKGVWHSNDSSGTTVAGSTSTPNNGTKLSSTEPAVASTGMVAGGLNYDGVNDKVTVADDNSLDITSAGSVSFWVKRDTTTTWDSLIAKGSANDDISQNYGMEITDLGVGEFYLGNGSSGSKLLTSGSVFSSTASYYYIVGTWNGTTQSIYVNGALNNSMAQGVTPVANVSPILIGLFSTSVDPFDGIIDEVRVANSARSVDWINAEYNNINAPSTFMAVGTTETNVSATSNIPPVLYWTFDEYNTTVNDSSGNLNTGTLGASTAAPFPRYEDLCSSGKCLRFDGSNDYVSRTYSSDTELDPGNGSFSASVWFRHPNSISAQQNIITRFNAGGWKVYMSSTGTVCFGIDNDGTSFPSDSTCSTASYADSFWHFVEVVKNGTTSIILYVDGKQVGTPDTTITASSITGTTPTFYVGIDSNGTSNPYAGVIDEVKYFNYAKTSNQVVSDYETRGIESQSSATFGTGEPSNFLSNGLIGYWLMDESSWAADCSTAAMLDLSGNANHGNACPNASAAAITTNGKFSSAGSFDGINDYISIPTSSQIGGSLQTISSWVNPSTFVSGASIYNRRTVGNVGGIDLELSGTGGAMVCYMYINGSWSSATTFQYPLATSQWNHVACTYDGQAIRVYVNGRLDVSTSVTGTINDPGSTVTEIGRNITNTALVWNGKIDEMRIYNRGLTTSEIAAIYDWGTAPLAYWKFDDGTGTTASDSGGSGFNGTLTNGPTWSNGKFGKALNFDGSNDRVDVSSPFQIPSLAGTISVWVNPTSSGVYDLLSSGTSLNDFRLSPGNNLYGFYIAAEYRVSYSTDPPANTWTYVTLTWDQTNGSILYYNGIRVASNSSPPPAYNQTGLKIGSNTVPAEFFPGKIDELKSYNYARTPKQIISDMNGGHPSVGSPVGSPVGYWKFDEGYGTTTRNSGNGGAALDMTLSNSTWTNNGKYNKALDYNGTNAVTVLSDTGLVEPTGDMALSAWFKLDTLPSVTGTDAKLVFKAHSASPWLSYELLVESGDNKVYIDWANTSGTYYATQSNAAITAGTWYYAAGVKTGNYIKLYLNGVYQSTVTATGTMYNSDSLLQIGAAGSERTDGIIDEVKLYNYALNDDEIKLDFNQGKSQTLGVTSTASDGVTADNSSTREYCVPGDTATCNAPVLEWKFDEGTGTAANDTSGNGLNGTLNNGSTWKQGKIGKSVKFDGSDDLVSVTDSSTLEPTGDMTVEAWVYFDTLPSSRSQNAILAYKRNSTSPFFSYTLVVGTSNKPTFGWANSGGTTYFADYTGAAMVVNTWYHVVGVKTGTVLKVYVNGNDSSTPTGATTGTILNSNLEFESGASSSTTDRLAGRTDNIRVYNYARSTAQVAWSYNKGLPTAHWKFDEGTSTTANDSSGNGYAGTLTNGPTWNTTGKINSGVLFDGTDDYVQVSDTANLRFDASSNDFSIFAWVRRSTTGTQYIISKEDADNDGWRMMFNASNQVVCSEDVTDVTSTSGITDTNWHFVGCTIDRDGNGQTYIDGVANGATVAMGTDAMATTSNIRIGTRSYTSTNYFSNTLDEIKIFSYVLTPNQILTLYNNGAVNFAPSSGSP